MYQELLINFFRNIPLNNIIEPNNKRSCFNFTLHDTVPFKRDKIIRKLKNKYISYNIYLKVIDKQPGFVKTDIVVTDNKETGKSFM